MAISIGNSNTFASTGNTAVHLTVPTGTTDGDLMLACAGDIFSSSTSLTTPAGWTPLNTSPLTATGAIMTAGVYYRIAEGETAGTTQYTWTMGGTHKPVGILQNIKGAWLNFDNNGNDNNLTMVSTGTTTPSLPIIATHNPSYRYIIGFLVGRNGTSGKTNNATTVPTGWTKLDDIQTTATTTNNGLATSMYLLPNGTETTAMSLVNSGIYFTAWVSIVPQYLHNSPPLVSNMPMAVQMGATF